MPTLTTRLLPAIAAAAVLVLAGCSAGTSDAAAPAATAAPQQQSDGPQRSGPGGGGGASGEIASVTGTVMQVRSTDAQTAVTWTDATTFSASVAGALPDVTVGSCVVAVSTSTSSGETDTGATAPLEATSIQLTTAADDGTCTGGFGGGGPGGGPRPDGAPTDLPSMQAGDRPSGAPTDLPPGGAMRAFDGVAGGKVTAIDGSTLTVEVTGQDDATTSRTVTVTDATTYTKSVVADASAVVVGQCASARGEADDSGKVTATSIAISAPTDGECSAGFTGRGFPGGGPGQGGSGTDQQGGSDA
ncbi:MAG: hypothetical protein ABWY33_04705 [Cellulomonas sp.]